MESYITNRNQYVEIDNTNSDTFPIMTGVPQVSMLGPLLFIIHIHDIVSSSKPFDFIIYADDTTQSTTIEIIIKDTNKSDPESIINKKLQNIDVIEQKLKPDICNIVNWFDDNRIAI